MALYMHDVYAELSIKYIVAFESNNVSTDGHVQNLVMRNRHFHFRNGLVDNRLLVFPD